MESKLYGAGAGNEEIDALPNLDEQPASEFDEGFAILVQQQVMSRKELGDNRPPQEIANDFSQYLNARVRESQERMTGRDEV